MKIKFHLLTLVLACSGGIWMTGCGSKSASTTPTTGEKPNSTLTQAEADKQIQSVKDNKSLPEDAKDSIISEIQAKVTK